MDVRTLLDPFKEYIYAAVAVAVIVAAIMFIHHERAIGQAKLAADYAKNELKWQAKVDKVEQNAASQIRKLEGQLLLASVTPPPNPVHVRVCGSTGGKAGTVRPDSSPGAGGHVTSRPGEPVADDSGPDIGPPTELLLTQLKAEIDYLQGYIRVCQEAGACER